MFGFRGSACRDGTNCSYRICNNALVTAAIPAADSRCPMFDLTDPIGQNCFSSVEPSKAFNNPVISMGSPSDVPVPCVSM